MKYIIAVMTLVFASICFADDTPALPKKSELNCVTKDKKGNCPPAPKSAKPTPKKKAEPTK